MCCFSRPVKLVANTQIFARPSTKGKQYVVYSMKISAAEDLAMVLPLPTPENAAEDAVRFINLEGFPDFFDKLREGFPAPPPTKNGGRAPALNNESRPLPVVAVGSFEASFVPSVKDFARLDARFRLPEGAWEKLPSYKNFGFAVFKLKAGAHTIHPMAFEFPRREPKRIFFPTVHIHDGEVHEQADFDHALYLQPGDAEAIVPAEWQESTQPPGLYMDVKKAQGIVDGELHVYRRYIRGQQKNEDTLV